MLHVQNNSSVSNSDLMFLKQPSTLINVFYLVFNSRKDTSIFIELLSMILTEYFDTPQQLRYFIVSSLEIVEYSNDTVDILGQKMDPTLVYDINFKLANNKIPILSNFTHHLVI